MSKNKREGGWRTRRKKKTGLQNSNSALANSSAVLLAALLQCLYYTSCIFPVASDILSLLCLPLVPSHLPRPPSHAQSSFLTRTASPFNSEPTLWPDHSLERSSFSWIVPFSNSPSAYSRPLRSHPKSPRLAWSRFPVVTLPLQSKLHRQKCFLEATLNLIIVSDYRPCMFTPREKEFREKASVKVG